MSALWRPRRVIGGEHPLTGVGGRARRALVVAVATIVLAAAGLTTVAVASSAVTSGGRTGDRSVVSGTDHHDAVTVTARRAGPDLVGGPGVGVFAGAAVLVLWAASSAGATVAGWRDRRRRWRARLVGAPPSSS